MDRYTRKDAEKALQRLCKATGKQYGWTWDRVGNRNVASPVGAWMLDYNATYGGCEVHELHNESGGVSEPLGSARVSPREFCQMVWFALRVLSVTETEKVNI